MRTKACQHCKSIMVKLGKAWHCPECGATAPLRKPGPAPDTPLRLGTERRAFLAANGGASAWIKSAIDKAMTGNGAQPGQALDWDSAWQLAGEICEIAGNTTARQHEQIASLLQKLAGHTFDTFRQNWR